jgi:hypothetical protein
MKPLWRKILASASVTLGMLLVLLEISGTFGRGGAGGGCFWIIVGGLLVILGTLELMGYGDGPSLRG